jgi:chromosomal replication initiator protein
MKTQTKIRLYGKPHPKERLLNRVKNLKKKFIKTKTSLRQIEKVIRDYFLTKLDFNEKTRKGEYVYLRQICHYFSKKETKEPEKIIGLYFGNKDRTTVLHSIKVIEGYLLFDKKKREEIKEISKIFRQLKNND